MPNELTEDEKRAFVAGYLAANLNFRNGSGPGLEIDAYYPDEAVTRHVSDLVAELMVERPHIRTAYSKNNKPRWILNFTGPRAYAILWTLRYYLDTTPLKARIEQAIGPDVDMLFDGPPPLPWAEE